MVKSHGGIDAIGFYHSIDLCYKIIKGSYGKLKKILNILKVQKYSLKKIDIVNNLSINTGLSKSYSKKIIDDLVQLIGYNIKSGSFYLKNFGTFNVVHKKERQGRNPKTKETFLITSRKSIIFKSSKKILKSVNQD